MPNVFAIPRIGTMEDSGRLLQRASLEAVLWGFSLRGEGEGGACQTKQVGRIPGQAGEFDMYCVEVWNKED